MRSNWLFKLRLTFECIRMEIDRLLNPDLSSFYPMNDDGTFRFKPVFDPRLMVNYPGSTIHRIYTIPVTGLSEEEAQKQISELIADYKDHVTFNDATGEIYIDGKKNTPFQKEYWFPSPLNDDRRPVMDELTGEIWFSSNDKKDLN